VLDQVTLAVHRYLSEHKLTADPRSIAVDTSGFSHKRIKLGLGSSAAVCAAAAGLLFEGAGLTASEHTSAILDLCLAAHRRAQQDRGSGADVAAAVLGGALIYEIDRRPVPLQLEGLPLVAVWTGGAASTSELVGQVQDLARREPAAHQEAMSSLSALAHQLVQAYRGGEVSRAISLTRKYGQAMNHLGQLAGAPIVTPTHERIAALAVSLDGAAKPSGAGGGDTAIALFENSDPARRFARCCQQEGWFPLNLKFGAPGLRRGP
jgi:phosphomevalonate kinase